MSRCQGSPGTGLHEYAGSILHRIPCTTALLNNSSGRCFATNCRPGSDKGCFSRFRESSSPREKAWIGRNGSPFEPLWMDVAGKDKWVPTRIAAFGPTNAYGTGKARPPSKALSPRDGSEFPCILPGSVPSSRHRFTRLLGGLRVVRSARDQRQGAGRAAAGKAGSAATWRREKEGTAPAADRPDGKGLTEHRSQGGRRQGCRGL